MKKSVSFIIGSMIGGGAERVISIISEMYVKNGYEVHLIIFRKTENTYYINPLIKCHYLSEKEGRIKRNLKLPFLLANKMKEINSNVYISFCIQENCIACLVNFFVKKKLIISERNAPNNEKISFYLKIMRKMFYRVSDGMVFQTEDAQKSYSIELQKKSVVIANPIKDNLPDKMSYVSTKKIVAVGRLAVQKNYEMLLQSFLIFSQKFPNYKLYIYGIGPLKEKLENLSKILGIQKKVCFMGFSKNVHLEIIDADIYVMSSDYEGMPNSLMEAMAIGIPSISTDCPSGGPKSLIKNKENGVLVGVNDYEQLAIEMIKLAENQSLREKMGDEAKKIRNKYNKESIFKLWKKYTDNF